MQGVRLTPAPRAALLARDRARSDDLEAGDGPDPVRPPAEPPIHPFTGKFADAEHTVAYRSQAFRMMMPLHIAAMTLMIVIELLVLASVASTGNAASDVAAEVASDVARPRCPSCSAPLGGPSQGPTFRSEGLDANRRIGYCYT